MMNKNLFLIVTLSLLTIIIILAFLCYNKTKTLNVVIETCQDYLDFVDVASDKLNEINSIGYSLDQTTLFNIDGELTPLSEIVNDGEKVFFRFSMTQCNSCYESQFEILRDMRKDLSRLIIIADVDDNLKKIALITERYDITSPLYKLTTKYLPIPIDSLRKPYFYILNKDMIPRNLFIPNKKIPNLSIRYINQNFTEKVNNCL